MSKPSALNEWLERYSLVKYARGQTRSEAKAPPNRSNQKAPHEAAHVAGGRMRRHELPAQRHLLPTKAPVLLAYRKHACPEANANKPRGYEASNGYPENGIYEGVHLSSNAELSGAQLFARPLGRVVRPHLSAMGQSIDLHVARTVRTAGSKESVVPSSNVTITSAASTNTP